ncbi:hypothetical protein CkaCkLH20_12253 [Colletotrichum karsti]|uniref:Uncharacterized protein n=1 Tax=Colletotrichum karsti TaxID=1095194 RepID=A0A9P6HU28_9PEZI|nr:uncharacterized protein CkaCkLH20_12253 [Colletotrichum karsti]KAF9870289.1 hypothetical protein CkaCkLH20_12253 [Colletotrichum karsti]
MDPIPSSTAVSAARVMSATELRRQILAAMTPNMTAFIRMRLAKNAVYKSMMMDVFAREAGQMQEPAERRKRDELDQRSTRSRCVKDKDIRNADAARRAELVERLNTLSKTMQRSAKI